MKKKKNENELIEAFGWGIVIGFGLFSVAFAFTSGALLAAKLFS